MKYLYYLNGLVLSILMYSSTIERFTKIKSVTILAIVGSIYILITFFSVKLKKPNKLDLIFIFSSLSLPTYYYFHFLIFGSLNVEMFIMLNSSIIIGLITLINNHDYFINGLIKGLLLNGFIVSILLIVGSIISGDYRNFFNIVDYLALGYNLSLSFLILVPAFAAKRISKTKAILIVVILFGIFLSNSRGAVIFSLLVPVYYIIFIYNNEFNKGKLILIALFVVGGLTGIYNLFNIESGLNRLFEFNFVNVKDDVSTFTRILIWEDTIQEIAVHPIVGWGLGNDLPNPYHPHNFILQILYDGGIIAFMIWAIILYQPIRILKKTKNYLSRVVILGLYLCFIYMIMEYSKSHVIYSARNLFIVIALLIGVFRTKIREKNKYRLLKTIKYV
ncbi:O-antigen ligase family protein [Balneola vulgaris]|uniref:O-antigen ligase family protein n=1 Tax=Balneola vulgaris TaxID=287535 RepID=UPI0003A51959|nr:O-antigen ligase family protein [Balneola vulgaris]